MKKEHIVLVEDEPAHAVLLKYNLERYEYIVDHFEDVEMFFAFLQETSVDLIIISVQFSEKIGHKLCKTIRSLGYLIPILFVTTGTKQEGCECGNNIDYLIKPISTEDLFEKVQRLIKK